MGKRVAKHKKRKAKRPTGHEVTFGDYVLVIENDDGSVVRTILRTDYTRPPSRGDGVRIRASEVNDQPDLAGSYVVQFVEHAPPPDGAVTLTDYSLPWCYVRRSSARARVQAQNGEARPSPEPARFTALDGHGDLRPFAEDFRALATELEEERDLIAAAVRESGGRLDPGLPDRLHSLSRRAKQRYVELTVNGQGTPTVGK